LGWEAYREAADDTRYLTTLQTAIAEGGPGAEEAQAWLDAIPEDVNKMLTWIPGDMV